MKRLREGTFKSLIQQEMGWLDQQNIGELTSRLNSDTNTVANCLGLNLNIMLRNALQVARASLTPASVFPARSVPSPASPTQKYSADLYLGKVLISDIFHRVSFTQYEPVVRGRTMC